MDWQMEKVKQANANWPWKKEKNPSSKAGDEKNMWKSKTKATCLFN